MGAGIEGEGTSTIRVHGVSKRRGATHTLWGTTSTPAAGPSSARSPAAPSRSLARALKDVEVAVAVLRRLGVQCTFDETRLLVEPSKLRSVGRITTGLWPGFPSDLVSLVTVLATQAEGGRSCTTGCTSCGSSRWTR
jgi:UDP-N-acetylglucosamine 1-carboxyvinyltransferase